MESRAPYVQFRAFSLYSFQPWAEVEGIVSNLPKLGGQCECVYVAAGESGVTDICYPFGDDKSLGHGHAMEGITAYLFYIRWYNRSATSFDKYASSTLYDGVAVLTGVIHGVVGTDFNG